MAILMNPNKKDQSIPLLGMNGKRPHYDTYPPLNSDPMLFHMYHDKR